MPETKPRKWFLRLVIMLRNSGRSRNVLLRELIILNQQGLNLLNLRKTDLKLTNHLLRVVDFKVTKDKELNESI